MKFVSKKHFFLSMQAQLRNEGIPLWILQRNKIFFSIHHFRTLKIIPRFFIRYLLTLQKPNIHKYEEMIYVLVEVEKSISSVMENNFNRNLFLMLFSPKSQSSTGFETEELEETNSTFREFIRFLRDLLVIFIIVILIRVFLVTPFRINGSSMESSYHDKEYILVDKLSYLDFENTNYDSNGYF